MATKIQIRRGTAKQWGASNPQLSAGEISVETDTLKMKIGDGHSNYSQLRYIDEDDEIYLGKWIARTGTISLIETDGAGFDKYCDFWFAKGVKPLEGPELSVKVFGEDGGILGSCGPGLSKDEIVSYVEDINATQPVYVIFYLKTVGDKINVTLYNSAYSGIHGGLKERSKKVADDSSRNIKKVIKQIMNTEFFGNKVVQDYEMDSALKAFRFTDTKRLGSFYQPGTINMEGFDDGQLEDYYLYDNNTNQFVPFSFESHGSKIIKHRTLFLKPGMISFDGGETFEFKVFVETSPSRDPIGLGDYDEEPDWQGWGVACLYVYKIDNNYGGSRYNFFRIGGCGNDKLAMNIQNQVFQIGLTEDNPICYPYIEFSTTNASKKIRTIDKEIDCSYPLSGSEQAGGDRPFHCRMYADEIIEPIKHVIRAQGGQAKFRIGIYNPETHTFSKPSNWMRLYKRIGIADFHMQFIN